MVVGNIFIFSFVGLGFGIFIFARGFIWQKEKRLIENTPTSKIRSIAMGLVEIYGKAVPPQGKILKSPFTNKDCCYYKYTVKEYRKSGKSSHWVTLKRGEESNPFYLKDNTGTVLIDPDFAKIDIPIDSEYKSSFGKDPPETVKKFLRSQGINFETLFGFNKTMRYREYFIAPGDNLYVMGTAADNPHVREGSAQKSEEDVMIQKGKSFYYISDKPEKEVLKTYKWKVIGGLFGGSALIIVCLAVIFGYIGIL